MAAVSKMKRKLRRAKREASRALRMVDFALNQRDQARFIAASLNDAMKLQEIKHGTTIVPGDSVSGPSVTITKVEEPNNEESSNDNPTSRA